MVAYTRTALLKTREIVLPPHTTCTIFEGILQIRWIRYRLSLPISRLNRVRRFHRQRPTQQTISQRLPHLVAPPDRVIRSLRGRLLAESAKRAVNCEMHSRWMQPIRSRSAKGTSLRTRSRSRSRTVLARRDDRCAQQTVALAARVSWLSTSTTTSS